MKETRARQERNEHTGERRRGSLVRMLLERPRGASDRREPVHKEGRRWQSKVLPLSEAHEASADAAINKTMGICFQRKVEYNHEAVR